MNVGNLTWAHLGKTATIRNEGGGSVTGTLSSMEYSWGELSMGKMVMAGSASDERLKLTIGGWPIVAALQTEIEVGE